MAPPPPPAQLTLPDGRLHVGTHLPLLAQRYKYLSTLGEGASAQVGAGWPGGAACRACRRRVAFLHAPSCAPPQPPRCTHSLVLLHSLQTPCPQVILAEDVLAPTPGRLVAIKVMRRQHAPAGQRVSGCPAGRCWGPHRAAAGARCAACAAPVPHPTPPPAAPLPALQEARALRYLHASAPGGAAPGVLRLLDSFTLGPHYCLVTGAWLAAELMWALHGCGVPAAALPVR